MSYSNQRCPHPTCLGHGISRERSPSGKTHCSNGHAFDSTLWDSIHARLKTAFRLGWEKGVRDFAIWKDGEQLVGCMQRPLKTVLAEGPDDTP